MALYLTPVAEKVLERMGYEGLLVVSGIAPRKRRIRLEEYLQAAAVELRLIEILPIILLYRPRVLHRLELDLKRHPQVQALLDDIKAGRVDRDFMGIPVADCLKTLENYRRVHAFKTKQQRTRNLNIRLSENDLTKLREVCKKRGIRNQSELLREWIERAYTDMS